MIVAELDSVGLLATAARPQPRALQYEDLSRLPYLNMVIKARRSPLPCPVRRCMLAATWLSDQSHSLAQLLCGRPMSTCLTPNQEHCPLAH